MRNMYSSERLFEDLFGFRRQFDEIFNRILTGKPWGLEPPEFKKPFNIAPAVEAYVDKEAKKYVCRMTLAGVEPKDLQIHAQANVLSIRGERKLVHRTKEIELMEGEIIYGVFERTLTLPEGVTVEKLTAEYMNGVLEIAAPVAARLGRQVWGPEPLGLRPRAQLGDQRVGRLVLPPERGLGRVDVLLHEGAVGVAQLGVFLGRGEFRHAHPVRMVDSYGRRRAARPAESAFDREMLEELRSLGYIR